MSEDMDFNQTCNDKKPWSGAGGHLCDVMSGATPTPSITLLKTSGHNPLSDYPHARFHCVVVPFQPSSSTVSLHCPNCYCYACDVPVKSCTSWHTHCFASSDQPEWEEYRRQILLKRSQATAKTKLCSSTATAKSSTAATATATATATAAAAAIELIPAGTPHGPHAEHLHDVSYSTSWPASSSTSSVRTFTPQVAEPTFHVYGKGVFCDCYTKRNEVIVGCMDLDGYDSLDGIHQTVARQDYTRVNKYSAVSGRGTPYRGQISDFETCWQCRKCHHPPPIDVNMLLNGQRKASYK